MLTVLIIASNRLTAIRYPIKHSIVRFSIVLKNRFFSDLEQDSRKNLRICSNILYVHFRRHNCADSPTEAHSIIFRRPDHRIRSRYCHFELFLRRFDCSSDHKRLTRARLLRSNSSRYKSYAQGGIITQLFACAENYALFQIPIPSQSSLHHEQSLHKIALIVCVVEVNFECGYSFDLDTFRFYQ